MAWKAAIASGQYDDGLQTLYSVDLGTSPTTYGAITIIMQE
jgi:hypothetical protein